MANLEYTVVQSNHAEGFIKKVNTKIAEGWELSGDLQATGVWAESGGFVYYSQAMTKEEKKGGNVSVEVF